MRDHALPLIESYRPTTFRSRGVATPFTTPLLAGARVRELKQTGIELVVPNPSGGRGVYIVHWPGVQALCNPTVHDTMLFRQFSRLATIDPASIRDAALEVAAAGHAGRDAVAAAEAARANDRTQQLLAHFRLLVRLVERFEPGGAATTSLQGRTPDLDQRASAVLHHLAPSLGRSAARLAGDIAAIGTVFAPIGIAREDRGGRVPRVVARLDNTHTGLCQWLDADPPQNEGGGLGRAIADAVHVALRGGKAMLATVQMALIDPAVLLNHWLRKPMEVVALASRCDWLLDGWERVCLLWTMAQSDASRRAALLEMATLVPVLPHEVLEWAGVSIPPAAIEQTWRVTSCNDAWRSGGAAFACIERNEQLRAMSA